MLPNLLSLFLFSYWCAYGLDSIHKVPSGDITMNPYKSTKQNAIHVEALKLVVDVTSSCIEFMCIQMLFYHIYCKHIDKSRVMCNIKNAMSGTQAFKYALH